MMKGCALKGSGVTIILLLHLAPLQFMCVNAKRNVEVLEAEGREGNRIIIDQAISNQKLNKAFSYLSVIRSL
jgi:hypothetical protein